MNMRLFFYCISLAALLLGNLSARVPQLLNDQDARTASRELTAAVTLTVTKGHDSVLLGDPSLTNMTAIPTNYVT
jgi:hypothetical protein